MEKAHLWISRGTCSQVHAVEPAWFLSNSFMHGELTKLVNTYKIVRAVKKWSLAAEQSHSTEYSDTGY